MKYISVASGSSGNCHYIQKNNTKILVDAGLSGKAVQAGLSYNGVDLAGVNAIFITHEHIDHIKGVGILSRRYDIPVYANLATWQAMGASLGKIREENKRFFSVAEDIVVGDLSIKPFSTSHDAADPCGFVFEDGNRRLAIATDLGYVTSEVEQAVLGCEMVVLEANHDVEMLKMGSYPYHLKRRVLSELGHLSNEGAGELGIKLVTSGTKALFLAHLSGENNIPLLAYETVASLLEEKGIQPNTDLRLSVLERGRPSGTVWLSRL